MLSERSKIVKRKRMGPEIFRQPSCKVCRRTLQTPELMKFRIRQQNHNNWNEIFQHKKGHSVVSYRFPHRPVWRVRRRASSRTFVQMVMERAPLEAADEKIWQSFENLKEVVNNIEFPVELFKGTWRKSTAMSCQKQTLLPSRTHRRGALGQVIYTLVTFNYILANTWISHPRMGVLFPSVIWLQQKHSWPCVLPALFSSPLSE